MSPRAGNSAEKLAARRVQNTLGIPYTRALRLVNDAKVPECNWGQAADAVLLEHAGEGYEELPDPRAQKTEEQPAAPAGATVVPIGGPFPGFPSEAELADRIFGPGAAESLGTAARYIERPSGPPVRVDGPGCTPAVVESRHPDSLCNCPDEYEYHRTVCPRYIEENESGELVRAGSLYSDKCAECTTGVSCEDAGHCLFEG